MKVTITKTIELGDKSITRTISADAATTDGVDAPFIDRMWEALKSQPAIKNIEVEMQQEE